MGLYNEEDEGIQTDSATRPELDKNNNGVVEDGLGNDAATEHAGAD